MPRTPRSRARRVSRSGRSIPSTASSTTSRCRRATRGSRSSAGATRCSRRRRRFDFDAPDRRGAGAASSATTATTSTSSPTRAARRGVLVNNHEYVNPNIMFPPTTDAAERRRRGDIYKAAQGMSVVELQRRKVGEPWSLRRRRPAQPPHHGRDGVRAHRAGRRLRPRQDRRRPDGPLGAGHAGNCSGGTTPWGTVLSGEENFNGYFAWAADTAEQKRYSGTATTSTETRLGGLRPAVRRATTPTS